MLMGQRHKKKRAPKGTGQPDPTKDRSSHDSGRGKKKMTLDDLANQIPSDEDLLSYNQYLVEENDRGAAVMAGALVEKALEDAIRSHLVTPEDGTADTWFSGINAPFRSFAAKIALGRALGMYGPLLETKLNQIRKVRNVFAHRMLPLDFKHPTLVEECLKLSFVEDPLGKDDPKHLFGGICLAVAKTLGTMCKDSNEKRISVRFP
jgi:hypothetical protein